MFYIDKQREQGQWFEIDISFLKSVTEYPVKILCNFQTVWLLSQLFILLWNTNAMQVKYGTKINGWNAKVHLSLSLLDFSG